MKAEDLKLKQTESLIKKWIGQSFVSIFSIDTEIPITKLPYNPA